MVDTIEELNKLMDEDVARMANKLGLPEGSSASAVSCEFMRLERVEKYDLPADASWGDIGAAQADISMAREKELAKTGGRFFFFKVQLKISNHSLLTSALHLP